MNEDMNGNMNINENKTGTIYVLENMINGKCYVGQTINIKRRMREHKHDSHNYDYPIHRALKKYGFENFKQYIFNGIPLELLDYFEKNMIIKNNTMVHYGYNLNLGGNSNKELSEETKKKIGLANIGRVGGMRGKHQTEEAKKKISLAISGENHYNYGKHRSSETIEKMRRAMIGRPNLKNRGRIKSEETRKKISESNKGKKSWNKGKKLSEEHRKKLSEAHRGIPNNQLGLKRSIECKKKMSLAKKGKSYPKCAHPKMVICIETGNIYKSIKEATLQTGLNNISACCKHGITIRKYHWAYYKESA
jgi:group I intron endonuclease